VSLKQNKRNRLLPPVVPITPLIDIVFLLLIFFMLITKFLNPTIDLSLPESTTAQVNDEKSAVVQIMSDGALALDGEDIAWDTLVDALRARGSEVEIVRVRADEDTRHREVIRAFDCIRAAGLTNIALEAQRPETTE
jgi:biopolymer transport protein ExbD